MHIIRRNSVRGVTLAVVQQLQVRDSPLNLRQTVHAISALHMI